MTLRELLEEQGLARLLFKAGLLSALEVHERVLSAARLYWGS